MKEAKKHLNEDGDDDDDDDDDGDHERSVLPPLFQLTSLAGGGVEFGREPLTWIGLDSDPLSFLLVQKRETRGFFCGAG